MSKHDLLIRFWSDEIEMSGSVPDEASAQAIRDAVAKALPGRPAYDRLFIDPIHAPLQLPPSEELVGLLLELGLSTADGSLSVSSTHLAVSGLTDSRVTHAAFDARLRILAREIPGHTVFNRICIVTADDLSLPLPKRPRRALRPGPILAPAVRIADLSEADYGPPGASLVATPIEGTPGGGSPPPVAAAPKTAYDSVDLVVFKANTYLVDSGHYDAIDEAVTRAKALPAEAGKVVLRGYPDQAGSYDYNEWLGRQRVHSVKRFFTDAGVPENRLSIEIPQVAKGGTSLGKVLVLFPKPAVPGTPLAEASEPAPDGSAPQLASPVPAAR